MTQSLQGKLLAGLVGCLLFVLTASALQQANPLAGYPSLDGGYYLYVGQQIANGQVPYRDVWESKPPAIFYTNALGLILGRGTRWGVWLLEFICLLVAALTGFLVIHRQFGLLPALLATLVWVWGFSRLTNGGGYTEEFSLPFGFIAILAFWKSKDAPVRLWDFVIGLTCAINFLYRANNIGLQLAIVVVWLLVGFSKREYHSLRLRLVWSGLGLATGLGLVGCVLAYQGVLAQAINAALVYNFYITGEHINPLASLTTGILLLQAPAGLMLAGYLTLAGDQLEQRNLDPLRLLLLIDLPLEIVLSGLSGRNYPHYFIPWLPALAWLSAGLAARIADLPGRLAQRRPVLAVLGAAVILIMFAWPHLTGYQEVLQRMLGDRSQGVELDDPVASYVRDHSAPQDKILIWGSQLGLAYMAHRQEPTAYIFYPLYVPSPLTAHIIETYYRDLVNSPPKLIVDSYPTNPDLLPALDPVIRRSQMRSGKIWPYLPDNIQQVFDFILANYHLQATINQYRIYQYDGK